MPLSDDEKAELLRVARETLTVYLTQGKMPHTEMTLESLKQPRDAFVTLRKKNHELRGCIGSVRSPKPLYDHVAELAVSSATRDPRFHPVKLEELEDIVIEISVLSTLQRVSDVSEITAGVHGVLIEHRSKTGVFLPEVATEQGWDAVELLTQLCAHKAGLPEDAWKKGAALYRFTTESIHEERWKNEKQS